jgi:hypothetical protein
MMAIAERLKQRKGWVRPPHIQPPMAQVPRPMRETGVSIPDIRVVSMLSLQILSKGRSTPCMLMRITQ